MRSRLSPCQTVECGGRRECMGQGAGRGVVLSATARHVRDTEQHAVPRTQARCRQLTPTAEMDFMLSERLQNTRRRMSRGDAHTWSVHTGCSSADGGIAAVGRLADASAWRLPCWG